MKKRLFLTGPSGCGKTTMLRNALGSALANSGGFVTQRVLADDGRLLGFDLYPSAAAAGVEGFEACRFLDYSGNTVKKDNEVFRVTAARLLAEAEYYPFAVIDEFGGYEMLIPQFRDALAAFFNSGVPCIGVLKGAENAAALQRSFGLGDKYLMQLEHMREVIGADKDSMLVETTGRYDDSAKELVTRWVSEYAL